MADNERPQRSNTAAPYTRDQLTTAATRIFTGWAANRANRGSEYRPSGVRLSDDGRGLVVTISFSAHERRDEVPPEVPDWIRQEIVRLATPVTVIDTEPRPGHVARDTHIGAVSAWVQVAIRAIMAACPAMDSIPKATWRRACCRW